MVERVASVANLNGVVFRIEYRGGEMQLFTPLAHAIAAAAVGPHLHGVVCVGREARKCIRIRGRRDGMRLVTVHTNLPFGSGAGLRPAHRG